jgi:hypothetical protein
MNLAGTVAIKALQNYSDNNTLGQHKWFTSKNEDPANITVPLKDWIHPVMFNSTHAEKVHIAVLEP